MHKLLRLFVLGCLLLSYVNLQAQVGINTDGSDPDPSAMLDVQSTTKGVLIPRLSTTERQQIMNPAEGLMVYDSTAQAFYYFNGIGWLELLSGSVPTVVDIDGDTKIQVEESEDEDIIRFDVAGTERLALSSSDSARTILTMPNNANNILIGSNAGSRTNNGNGRNVIIGNSAGTNLIGGATNVILGHSAGQQNSTGNSNVFIGGTVASNLASGSSNIIIGKQAAFRGANINSSVMIGTFSGSNAAGSGNVFIGDHSGTTETAGNRLHINNGQGNQPLIYGEFDNRFLRIDGALNIGNKYTLPNLPGASGQVLKHNGTGTLVWASDADTDTDDQTLTFDGTNLTISEGNAVDISGVDTDTDDQTLSLDGTNLTISEGNAVDISGVDTDTDDQTLAFDGTNLTISEGNAVDISGVDTDTDDQTLAFDGTNLTISEGNTVDLSAVNSVQNVIQDTDGDTQIQVEKNTNEDKIRFDVAGSEAMHIDELGNVGIGKEPSAKLDIDVEIYGSTSTIINNLGQGDYFVGGSAPAWQSFTSTCDCLLFSVRLSYGLGTSTSIRVYEGEGTGGNLLYTGPVQSVTPGAATFSIGSVNMTAGSKYTIWFSSRNGMFYSSDNSYPGGRADFNAQNDFAFSVSVKTDDQDVQFTNDGLVLGGYTLPYTRGSTGQVLEAGANGAVNWVNQPVYAPVGTIVMWIGDENETVPTGWLVCDNRLYDTNTYPDLFALLGSNRTPDFLGRFPVGAPRDGINGATAISVGVSGGEEDKTLDLDNIPPHTHSISYREGSEGGSGSNYSDIGGTSETSSNTSSAGEGESFKIMPPFLGVQFLIRAE